MKISLDGGEIKMVYLNFPILSGEQTSEGAFVYCGKQTCAISVVEHRVELLAVCGPHLSPSNGLGDLW